MGKLSNLPLLRWADGGKAPLSGLKIHFIGIGGCGMSPAAMMLLEKGASVSGSDINRFSASVQMEQQGAHLFYGHKAAQLPDSVALVVISPAIPESNPELVEARCRGIPVMTYPQLIGELMKSKRGLAVAGTHGKSTTSALTAYLLRESGMDPSFIFGAVSEQLGGGSHLGNGPDFVVESCEFARSFMHFCPRRAAILNVDSDHLDCFGDFGGVVQAFSEFAAKIPPDGVLLLNHEDGATERLTRSARAPVETFGFKTEAHWRAENLSFDRGRCSFDVIHREDFVLHSRLQIAGIHNVANALAAISLAYHAGADPTSIAAALPNFQGVHRRMTWRGSFHGVDVVDDYAHHPRAISCTLQAMHEFYQPRRTWVVFQPHQHSRTRHLLNDFATCFDQADVVIIPDIYEARDAESERSRTDAQELVAVIGKHGRDARYQPCFGEIARVVKENTEAGDLVVTMGAGDVWKVADVLVA